MKNLSKPIGISVIIATMNREVVLLDTLHDIQNQSYRDYEVIVVDQSDEPNPDAEVLLSNYGVPGKYYYITHFRGLPEARNFGWRYAKKDIILYIDDDIRCGPEFLQAHFDAHISTGAAVVAGGITEAKGDQTKRGETGSFNWWTATPGSNYHFNKSVWCISGKGCNFSIRKATLAQIGGFDENLTVGAALYEETELGLRLNSVGHRCWFAPEAHLTHLAAPMGGCRVGPDTNRYMYGMGHNRAILIWRHLKFWHRPTAIIRMLLYGISYSRTANSLEPLKSAVKGMLDGRLAASQVLNKSL